MTAGGRSQALYGQLGIFSLNTILSALNLQKVTGRLTLAQYDQIAEIMVRDGEVVDAVYENGRGVNALLPLFSWENGVFSFIVQPADTQTINIPLPVLQLRAAVYLEEAKNGKVRPAAAAPAAPNTAFYTKEIPSSRHTLDLVHEAGAEVALKTEYWGILRNLVTGPQTVEKLAELTETRLETFVPLATEMVRAQMVRVVAPTTGQ
ncbi:MAG: DUF4388 domain-containing protein [Chloroflexi bacterium]|mgnify:CR=1 FL=1|nr:DUF4388 domain-containing protein [Chloroflexota bacterium]OJV98296.1 MAG: hypothetical protein BGO39_16070 [Chloroflexi bacterium 54-19]